MALTDRIETASLTGMHWLAGLLALVTGVIHLVLGVGSLSMGTGLAVAFLLAGLGYLGGLVLALVDYRRPLLYLVGVLFTALQVVLYYVMNYTNDGISTVEGVDKAVQLLLIVLLLVLYRRES